MLQGSVVQKLMAVLINCKEQEDYFPILMSKQACVPSFTLKGKEVDL
jgi:hypothetical protein